MAIIQKAVAAGTRSVFICDRQTLVKQSSDRFMGADIDHGVLMGDQSRSVWHDTIVASSQTIESRGFDWSTGSLFETDSANPPGLVIIDECHEIRKKVVDYCVANDVPLIGLSATPFNPALGKIYQAVVNVCTTNELLNDGWLCPVKVVGPEVVVDTNGIPVSTGGEWAASEVSKRVLRIVGDVVPEWVRRTDDFFGGPRPTIAFCPRLADSEALAEKFQAAGYDFRVVSYKQTADRKQEIIENFRIGRHVGLISCVALTKGFDVPAAQVMIDAYPIRKAFDRHIQKCGRIMRIATDKDFGLIIDHSENWMSFFNATHQFFDEGVPELASEKLRKVKRAKPETISNLKCHTCGFVMPKRERDEPPITECPNCGAAIRRPRGVLETVHGRLDQIDVVDGKGRDLPYEGDWWVQLCAVASAISPDDDKARKIALAKYRQIFGRWPKGDFVRTDLPPDPMVAKYSHNQYLRYKVAQREGAKKSAA